MRKIDNNFQKALHSCGVEWVKVGRRKWDARAGKDGQSRRTWLISRKHGHTSDTPGNTDAPDSSRAHVVVEQTADICPSARLLSNDAGEHDAQGPPSM